MGSGLSSLFPCIRPPAASTTTPPTNTNNSNNKSRGGGGGGGGPQVEVEVEEAELVFSPSEPLDETLGHSFCYVRSSNRFLSPTPSDRFVSAVSPSTSLRFSPSRTSAAAAAASSASETATASSGCGFKAISGASVSANTSTPRTVLQLDGIYDDATEAGAKPGMVNVVGGFESTASFLAQPLQPVPRGGEGFFLSGPLERGPLSGPLDPNPTGPDASRVPHSAPLGGVYARRKKVPARGRKGISGIKRAIYRNISEKKKKGPWVFPVLNFVSRKEKGVKDGKEEEEEGAEESHVQWALGKAGEDRVHVVVSEEQGWLFVGIYDGFNGPDAPEFLMGNLYRAVYGELQGLFWEVEEAPEGQIGDAPVVAGGDSGAVGGEVAIGERERESYLESCGCEEQVAEGEELPVQCGAAPCLEDQESVKRVRFQPDGPEIVQRRRLWEFLAEDDPEDGLDLSGSERFAFSVDDAISVGKAGSAVSRRWLLLSKLKQGLSRHPERKLFPWKFGVEGKEVVEEKVEVVSGRVEERMLKRKRKVGPVENESVIRAMSRALEATELAYLDMTDKVLDTNPELALMGSCLLVVLMRDEDVYVMNVGDSRAIVAQYQQQEVSGPSADDNGLRAEGTSNHSALAMKLTALQLSTDHSTSVKEEILRIKSEHPDDSQCIVNDRVKGRLKVTRAFGAGFLKKPKHNDAVLEMFRNEYIGTAPYISCLPSLHHHQLCPRDQFLVLSSDGLYQYLTNQEVVSHVESFMEKFPDGDPAQHLIEEVLSRAAKKAGMDFHELLDIPQGDRRKYHDDVTVMVISLEGRIWKSSGKYLKTLGCIE